MRGTVGAPRRPMIATPSKRAKPPQHLWRGAGVGERVQFHVLERGADPRIEHARDAGLFVASLAVCETCGCVAAHAEVRDAKGTFTLRAFGLDHDSLGVMHAAPSCEVLTMPARGEA